MVIIWTDLLTTVDTIDHDILLKKLDQSSIRGKKDSYLGPSSKVDTKVLKLMVLGLILLRPPVKNLLINPVLCFE